MSISQEQRRHLRERISEARSGQSLGQVISWNDIEALLDYADERDRYRALLAEASHFNFGRDSDLRERIEAALEGES